jgi:N-acetylneuraminate synthase/sialic acid synthase
MSSSTRELTLGSTIINDTSAPYTIAEIGHNHQGNLEQALRLIKSAAESGASAVKFQKRDNKNLFIPSMFDEIYNSENAFGKTYGEHREALEFGEREYLACIAESKKWGIDFFATPFDVKSAKFLNDLGVSIYKIASGDLQNLPLIEFVASFMKPMLISTGGSTFEMIDKAVNSIRKYHNNLAILQCTASYPASYEILNLRVIESLRNKYPKNVIGYSGHDNGISMALVAYTLGARVIEKHFTLNRTFKGTDHAFSLEPIGFSKMVRDLRRTSLALGDGIKIIYETEKAPIRKMGKMIVASRDLPAGHTLSLADFEFRSPADGISPSLWQVICGKRLLKSISRFESIKIENLEE